LPKNKEADENKKNGEVADPAGGGTGRPLCLAEDYRSSFANIIFTKLRLHCSKFIVST